MSSCFILFSCYIFSPFIYACNIIVIVMIFSRSSDFRFTLLFFIFTDFITCFVFIPSIVLHTCSAHTHTHTTSCSTLEICVKWFVFYLNTYIYATQTMCVTQNWHPIISDWCFFLMIFLHWCHTMRNWKICFYLSRKLMENILVTFIDWT